MSTSKLKKLYFLICIGILGLMALSLLVAGGYLYNFINTENPNLETLEIEIVPGSNPKQIAKKMYAAGLISNSEAFYYYFRFFASDATLPKAGFYEFAPGLTPVEVLDKLQKGRVKEFRVTIPEGSSKTQIAQILEDSGFGTRDDFIAAMQDEEILQAIEDSLNIEKKLGDIGGGLEGYLFPDTYSFPKGISQKQIIKRMVARLQQVLNLNIKVRISEQHLTLHEIMTLASIVEKETGNESERPVIAGVLLNRLASGMKLQTDPTVIYSIKDFSGNITKADLTNDNPYNTYVYAGLPPGPIASPGLAAIQAVLWPTQTKFLYFVSRNDGTHEFCETLNCHEKAVKTWQLGRKKSVSN